MACVVCGKRKRILAIDSIKYASENSVPEVLSIAIGNKLTNENWNDEEKNICLSCNRKCKEFDELNNRLQDLKLHLLKEYSKKIYRESQDEDAETEKKTRSKGVKEVESSETEIESREKEIESRAKEIESSEQVVESRVKDIKSSEGVESSEKEKDTNNLDNSGENETLMETEANEMSNNIGGGSVPNTTVTVTIKNEGEAASSDEADDTDWQKTSEKLPGSIAHGAENEKIRLVDRDRLHRLPDYEYQQWYTLDAYSYVLQTENNRGQLLKCSSATCPVSCRVTKQSALVKISGEHRHEPNVNVAERNKLYQKLKERCMEDNATPLLKIYEEEAQRHPSGASLLSFPEVRMREWRASSDPTIIIHTNTSTLEESSKKYHCDVCNMGFNSSRLLQRHADKHNASKTKRKKLSGAEPFVARAEPGDGRRLRKTLDRKLKRVIKKLKNGDESQEDAEDDENTNSKECHICHEKFSRLTQVKSHILREHKEVLMCEHCDVAFDTLLLLKRHKISCRKCCDERLEQKQKTKDDRQLEIELGRITGQDGAESLDQDPDDPDWEAGKQDESTADEGENAVPAKKKKTEDAHTVHSCQVCCMLFPTPLMLHNHMYTHSTVNKYECGTCGKSFNKKAVLTRHMISENHKDTMKLNEPKIELGQREAEAGGAAAARLEFRGAKFECVVCFASFPRQAALLHHMRRQKHITDQIIIHEPQLKPTPIKRTAGRSSRYFRDAIKENVPADSSLEGIRLNSKRFPEQPLQAMSGKKPMECAVCGDGFQSRIKLLAHMETTGHLTDSIVENIPVLEEMTEAEQNQIVPTDLLEVPIEIKQEPKVEIISQVILPSHEHKQELPDADDEAYFVQAGENGDGETVMVIQGDIDGSLTENMQLYMDEEGNIVTHDEDGNPVRVMQVDLSALRQGAEDGSEENNAIFQGMEEHHNSQYYQTRLVSDMNENSSEFITPDHQKLMQYQGTNETNVATVNFNQSHDFSQSTQYNPNETQQETPVNSLRPSMPQINIEIDENDEGMTENIEADDNSTKLNETTEEKQFNVYDNPEENQNEVSENVCEASKNLNVASNNVGYTREEIDKVMEGEAKKIASEQQEIAIQQNEIKNKTVESEIKTNYPNIRENITNEDSTKPKENISEADDQSKGEEKKKRIATKTPKKSEIEKNKAPLTPRTTRHSLKVESQKVEKEKISTRSKSTKK